ncbi:uncharacterized protein KGF55_002944 [Candida pseudojiufengensis]|uniref:uncharacterized protein n=1 Tax=Candida pseudojiufengensis TaxID=497109 RepID=UPI0022248F41|nr:uncharacterized protein KGF55_002944 [Candida pseudojiufengensis]KAI5963152.1 hypothetical protein KGF55_002944 [Candida pseudojiufengensis]
MNHENIDDSDDIQDTPNISIPKKSKLSFKKFKPVKNESDTSKTSRRSNLTFEQNDEEKDEDDFDIRLTSNRSVLRDNTSKSSKLSFKSTRRENQQEQPRRIQLSKYKSKQPLTASTTIEPNQTDYIPDKIESDEALEVLSFDEEDPDNNPVIANIDEIDETFKQKYLNKRPNLPEIKPAKKYVPIETNKEPSEEPLSRRKYLTQLSNEYKNFNYDDGTGEFEKQQRQQNQIVSDIIEEEPLHDFELSDSDMGTIKKPNFDSTKYNLEISESENDDENNQNFKNMEEIKILSFEEQIENLTSLINAAEIETKLRSIKRTEILSEIDKYEDKKEKILLMLKNLV